MKPEQDKGSVQLRETLKIFFIIIIIFFNSENAIFSANAILSNSRNPRHESDLFFIFSVVLY